MMGHFVIVLGALLIALPAASVVRAFPVHLYEQLLRAQLGVDELPSVDNATRAAPVPAMVWRTFQRHRRASADAKVQRQQVYSYTHDVDSQPANNDRSANHFHFHFDVTNIPRSHYQTAAHLQLSYAQAAAVHCTVAVYDVLEPDAQYTLLDTHTVGERTSSSRRSSSSISSIDGENVLQLNVERAVQRWLNAPHAMHGLHVHVDCPEDSTAEESATASPQSSQHIRLRRDRRESDTQWAEHEPTLFVYTMPPPPPPAPPSPATVPTSTSAGRRSKRSATDSSARQPCRSQPMYVDFSTIGWSDWIVGPPGFDANFCHGQCRNPRELRPTHHALFQAEIHRIAPHMTPPPCCVPTRFDSITVLYKQARNKFLLTTFEKMVASECGCR